MFLVLLQMDQPVVKVVLEKATRSFRYYPIGRPVRATITLYPIGRPVRATITLYPIGRPVLELQLHCIL